jgi:hypothetical protein
LARGRAVAILPGSMRRSIAALALAAVVALPAQAAAAGAPTVVHGWRVNLDGDAHVEHVQLMLQLKPNPSGGTVPIRWHWLQVVDRVGGHTVKTRITPIVEHMLPRWIRIGDFNRDGRPEIFYRGFTGGAGAVPVYAGIRGWTGTHRRRFWSYGPPFPQRIHNGHRYRYVGASVALQNRAAAATPGLEVHVVQGEARPAEPDCCPSQLLIRDYRFRTTANAWVLYHTVWQHT